MPDFISYNKAIEANNLATVANKNCRSYKANTDFEMGDLTIYDDKIYQALSSFKSAISFDVAKWKLIADVNNGNAISILGIDIDDTNKANGKVLAYNSTDNKIEYIDTSDIIVVDTLPSSPSSDKIYILPDFSMNYYDGNWHKLNDNQIVISVTSLVDTTKLWLDISDSSKPILKWYNSSKWINIGGISSEEIARNVSDFRGTVSEGATNILLQWTNPNPTTSTDFQKREIYVHDSDLINMDRDYWNANATLLDNTMGTGVNAIDSYTYTIPNEQLGKTLYFRSFCLYDYGTTIWSTGAGISLVAVDNIAPNKLEGLTAIQNKDSITVSWTSNPTDSDFAGVLIKMNDTNQYPTDRFSGMTVFDGKLKSFTINNLDKSKSYSFRAFTYDTSNNYNNDTSMQTQIVMDNTPPSNVGNVTVNKLSKALKINWTVNDNTHSDWAGVRLVIKQGESYPLNISDGTYIDIFDINQKTYTFSGLQDDTLYSIKLFPFDKNDNYNSNLANTIQGTPYTEPLNNLSMFKATNINNGQTIKLDYTVNFAPSGTTYQKTVIYGSKLTDLQDLKVSNCSSDANTFLLYEDTTTAQGGTGTYNYLNTNANLPFNIGDIINLKAFMIYATGSASGNNIAGYIVKDETPCLDYTNISFIGYDSMARLKYTDPVDTDWSKTIVIISKNGYISDENSSSTDIIQKIISTTRNEYSTNALEFNSLINGTQYYISLFSYDTSNNVNRNIVNRATTTPSAITVTNPINFTATSNVIGTQINLSWVNPNVNYTSRELYGSTVDITELTREQCQSGGYLLNSGVGTGGSNVDNYTHTEVTYNTTYYYKIFTKYTYNTVDYYSNGSIANAIPLDTQAPLDLVLFTATPKDGEIDLAWSFNASDIDIQKIVIVRNSTNNPSNESDGTVVVNSNITNYNDIGLTNGITYYYRAFIYDIHGNINSNDINNNKLNSIPIAPAKEYGVNWNKSTDVVTRLGSAVSLNASVVNGNTSYTNDFDGLYPWKDMKRVNLSDVGVENAIYGDITYKTDGTNGQCMVRVPKFYYKVVNVDTNNIQFWIADAPKSGYEVHPAFFRCRDKLCDDSSGVVTEVDKRYHHTYLPYLNSTKLESKSGVSPSVSINLINGRTYAKNRGNGWGLVDFNLRYAIQLLYLIEYASFDSQTKIGRGFVDGNTASHVTGGTDNCGNASYGETTGKMQMSYRGIEDFYGNCNQWIDGFYCDANRNILIGNKGFNNSGTGYTTYTTGLGSDISGYISDIFGDKTTGFAPKICSGSATTKLYDQSYLYASYLPIVGGYWAHASNAGVFCFFCTYPATTGNPYIASSLSF